MTIHIVDIEAVDTRYTKQWKELGEEYLKPVKEVIRMARKQATLELVKLPIFGAE